MMDRPLLVSSLLEHARYSHPQSEIVTRCVEGGIHRYTIGDAARRCAQLANALTRLGIEPGDRMATLAWNTYRHYELYFGISGIGAVVHTINPRLFHEQLAYIINHAADRYIFVDLTFIPLLEAIQDQIPQVEGFIILTDRANMPQTDLPNVLCYEELIAGEKDTVDWPLMDENSHAALCYTSGTTGNPKGVMYSHRSTVLHCYGAAGRDAMDIDQETVVLPVVPMFHVNAWGTPYSATMTGATLVLPGPLMDGKSLWELIDQEQVTLLLGVPTIWLMLLDYMNEIGEALASVEKVIIGGSAVPLAMVRAFEEKHDANVLHAWGMTEMSPLGTINALTPAMKRLPLDERYQMQLKQGRPVYGVELKIVDDNNKELPRDGISFGRLLVRGPWVIQSYYRNDNRDSFIDGWFDTGDVATLDQHNYMQVVDRSKDIIKSGGEWISSIDLENAAMGHPELAECCVIGAKHEKWNERPILLAVRRTGAITSMEQVLDYLADKVAKWWLPDAVIFVDQLPHTATGKLLKTTLREQYQDCLMTA